MPERLFGLETEYAFAATGARGMPLSREQCVNSFMQMACQRLPHLRGRHSSGIFLQNGARFYVDCGLHPELTTPECTSPTDAVRYVLAGERILCDLAAAVEAANDSINEVMIFKGNVDYSGTHATWGCHESYLHRAEPVRLPGQLIPHLVSRVVYAGAGGYNPMASGIEFTLSPRAFHLVTAVSGASTENRGIFHTKDESLSASGYHRAHILCGESLSSELANWLRVGATALVVAMIENGLHPAEGIQLVSPLRALYSFARDLHCRVRAPTIAGKGVTAVMVQRHYLELAEAHVGDAWMPPWAETVCEQWRKMLDLLGDAPESVETTLDWAIKNAVYRDHVRRRGLKWRALIGSSRLKNRLFEIDTRFGQLGDRGIFSAMDRSGVLTHHVAGVDNVAHAVSHPPATGRARFRGECVRDLWRRGGRGSCDWDGVWDDDAKRLLDLTDPLVGREHWRGLPEPRSDRLWRRVPVPTPAASRQGT